MKTEDGDAEPVWPFDFCIKHCDLLGYGTGALRNTCTCTRLQLECSLRVTKLVLEIKTKLSVMYLRPKNLHLYLRLFRCDKSFLNWQHAGFEQLYIGPIEFYGYSDMLVSF